MTKQNWKDKLGVYSKKSVTREINGVSWEFHPVSVSKLFELKETIKALFSAFAGLFGKNGDDTAQEVERITQEGGTIERTNVGAISPELAAYRDKQRAQTVSASIEALLSDSNKLTIGRLLCDSLRNDFERDCPDAEVLAFIKELDIAQMIEMILGFAEANAKVFGPLGQRMKAKMESKLRLLTDQPEASASERAPAPSTPQS